ncbi:SBBP repeat-containing protein [Ramlibacter henchirensis]|uniref:SBBP repeat-containing protein n=1 Tax=Ramlibacter henchirensis TaxID=204072 RepID=UPI0014319FB2|nr:SBBP repeat-containing protein [Ramlibacter henchirensis]
MLALLSGAAIGQVLRSTTTWGGTGSDIAHGVAVAGDGSSYVVGLSDSFTVDEFNQNRAAISLVKFAADGSLAWQRLWTGTTFHGGLTGLGGPAVALSPGQDAVYVSGLTSTNGNDAVLLKFATDGTLLWQRTWGGSSAEEANGVATDSEGSVYVAGTTTSFGPSSAGVFVLKFSAAGTLVWQKIYDGASGFAVGVAPDGNVYAAGSKSRDPFGGNFDMLVLKMTSAGALLWDVTYSAGVQADPRGGMTVASDGSPIIAGAVQAEKGGIVGIAALVVKLAANNGALVFDGEWGGREGSEALGVAVGANGSVYVAGQVSQGDRTEGAFVFSVDTRGRGISAATWGGTEFESGHGVGLQADGTVVLAATTSAGPPYSLLEASRRVSAVRGDVAAAGGALADPAGAVADPNATVITPNGSTTFAGGFDTALVRFTPQP